MTQTTPTPDARIILETGIGTDLYGEDYTKAAIRAVNDAIRHSSLTMFSELGLDHRDMTVAVTIGVQEPDRLDTDQVAAELPRGKAKVTAVKGGQNIPSADGSTASVIATAAIEAYYPVNPADWKLSKES
ncbi:Lin0512 family protein [Neptunicoccus sediminis]|uniref:Lin0512 family protein n=1 Tax=Neptunicoccus sediminis TaxID=1892596 RepID=UPI0008460A73|nr:Lin0512 family protein [Neptunicoccus sediminis]